MRHKKASEMNSQEKEWLEKTKNAWLSSESHNSMLMSLAHVYYESGVEMDEAIREMQDFYTMHETPDKHEEHMREVVRACERKYGEGESDSDGIEYKEAEPRLRKTVKNDSYVDERKKWLSAKDTECGLYKEVRRQDVRDDREAFVCKNALKTLFKYVSGNIWLGKAENAMYRSNWIDTGKLDLIPNDALYMSIGTYGSKLYRKRNNDGTADAEEDGVFARTDTNVSKVACLVLEFDRPMDLTSEEELKSEAVKALPEDERKAYRDRILRHTCLILEQAGIKPTTITFSGGKSYHVLVRLATPVDKGQWTLNLGKLKSAYARIGADIQMLTLSRCTRMPCGSTKLNAEQGDCQRLMYIDPDAEMELSELADRLVRLADEICEAKENPLVLPMEVVSGKSGNKYVFKPRKWWDFLDGIRLRKVWWDNNERLMITNDDGVSTWLSAGMALDVQIDRIKELDDNMAAEFSDKMSSKLAQDNLVSYHRGVDNYNPPLDEQDKIFVPFRNGLLEITRDGCELTPDYRGFDIMDDTPSVKRDWFQSREKSEFQTFVEHACGSVEEDPQWKDRFKAICTLLGYLICRSKVNDMNYLCLLLEESMTANNGGTGKSLIMKAAGEWRIRRMKNMKTYDASSKRFFWGSVAQERPDYVIFDDLPQNIDLQDFYEPITSDLVYEQKGKDEKVLKRKDVPKLVGATNYFPRGLGNSFLRRVKFFEISNHYQKQGLTPYEEFGHCLYEGWDDEEWHRFDTFLAKCCVAYLRHGLVQYQGENSMIKMLDTNFKDLAPFFEDLTQTLPCWCLAKDIRDKVNEALDLPRGKRYTSFTIKLKLEEYCNLKKLVFDDNKGKTRRHPDLKISDRWIVISDKETDMTIPVTKSDDTVTETTEAVDTFINGGSSEGGDSNFVTKCDGFYHGSSDCKTTTYDRRDDVTSKTTVINKIKKKSILCDNNHPVFSGGETTPEFSSLVTKPSSGSDGGKKDRKPDEPPWFYFNGVNLSFSDEKDDQGNIVRELVWCKGKVPPPIEHGGELCYKIKGSYRKASGTGVVTDGLPVEFIVVD